MELSYPSIEERFWKKEVPSNETDEPAVIVDAPDQQPTFPGGDAELNKWVSNHIRYPAMAADSGIQGCVIVKFVVQKNGSIGEVKVSRGKDPGLDNEAVRVVKSLPKFIPGKLNGQAVNTWFTLPVNFRLH
ncbi:MAG: energy transducer TonB [Muribaculaceae bacterium]|nr:energy transducer TonB [Muribaculaceae bacterium]